MRDSLDFDAEDLEGGSAGQARKDTDAPPAYDAPRGINRDVSPLPAPVPQKPAQLPRESLDGETIFAIGEEGDKWSDDGDGEENEGEGRRLTGKGD